MKLKRIQFIFSAVVIASLSACTPNNGQTPTPTVNVPTVTPAGGTPVSPGTIYSQPPDPTGGLLASSWSSPDGNASDQYVWDNFTLASPAKIADVRWRGGYDPLSFGSGGPVLDFTIAIYPSISSGTQPDVNNPLVTYHTNGNAGETNTGTVGNIALYDYEFILPSPFAATAGTKYWIQIEATQQQFYSPDWGIAKGTGGDGWYFRKYHCGDVGECYQPVKADAAFSLLGPATGAGTTLP